MNIFNAISGTISKIFKWDIAYTLIGVGLGTANLNGEFARVFEWTHYSWMSTSYMFVETGLIGFVSYSILLILPYFSCYKESIYKNLSKISALFAIVLMIYDEALKTEAAYMIFFLASTGLISNCNSTKEALRC